jgi:hypothetical protein
MFQVTEIFFIEIPGCSIDRNVCLQTVCPGRVKLNVMVFRELTLIYIFTESILWFNRVHVPRSLGLFILFCRSVFVLFIFIIILSVFHRFPASTSSVNNNNNTCGFIYIALLCDFLICHQNPSMHEMFISLSPSDYQLHVSRFSIHMTIEGIIEVECIIFENLYFINWDQDINEIYVENCF